MTHLLDTSAWLTHLFGEAGAVEVRQIFNDPHSQVFVSALSLLEVYGRLKGLRREGHWPAIHKAYAAVFTKVLPVDEHIAAMAIQLRAATPARLPSIDGLIAATAVVNDLTLVHRDSHLLAIPAEVLRQTQLPDK